MSYRELKSYEQATFVYDFTVDFCGAYMPPMSRLTDQMVHAGRSGKQNIVEGSSERTSEKSELKLLGVARASFQELLEDYEDFLRQRSLPRWGKDDPLAREVRNIAYKTNKSYVSYKSYISDAGVAANAAICMIHQVNFLLDQQIRAAEQQFVKRGGYGEQLNRAREEEKKKQIVNTWNRRHWG